MNELILHSKEIIEKAIIDFKPKAIVLMFSGGDDSLTTYHVAKELGIKLDYVIHGNTRTGIEETTLFSRQEVERMGDRYLEADAGSSYEDYVMRKGFFGKGLGAHVYSYHTLKSGHFRRIVSQYLRQRKRQYNVLFINGARRKESENRMITMKSPIQIDRTSPTNIWVNLINEWEKTECKDYLDGNGIKRCEVAINLCRSGECMCGTMQSLGDRQEAGFFYPKWKIWLDDLEKRVKEKHGFGWGVKMPTPPDPNQLSMFQPMCVGCTTKNDK